ncbi:MAG TPA: FkbM family methyltransferase [Alphaproteobacteria bacterium]
MLKIVKDLILKTSRSFGFEIMPLRDVCERDFAIHLGQLFDEFGIDCVFDVGANSGQYRDFLRERVFYAGLIVSFEPVARNIDILRQRSQRDRHWIVEDYALSAQTGTLSINVTAESQLSSFLTPDYTKLPRIEGFNVVDHTETVATRTLDDVFPKLRERLGFRNAYLKIDTQGHDMEVLHGGIQTLDQFCALQTEASVIGIYKDMPGYMETIKYLGDHYFDVTGFYPIQRDRRLRLIEFDCVAVNRAVAQIERAPGPRQKVPRDGRALVEARL